MAAVKKKSGAGLPDVRIKRLRSEVKRWKADAFKLRSLLDNIDTADDACSTSAAYRRRVRDEVEKANEILVSLDGQRWVTPPKPGRGGPKPRKRHISLGYVGL